MENTVEVHDIYSLRLASAIVNLRARQNNKEG